MRPADPELSLARPDVTLLLDGEGVIQRATFAGGLGEGGEATWRGRSWIDTVEGDAGEHVRRMVEDARTTGVSAFCLIPQRFPDGREVPIEYTTVRLGDNAGLIAVGRSVQTVSVLQSRLVEAQRAMEMDAWKLRDIETRYRLLFDTSSDAVLLVSASDLRIQEANPAAVRALGLHSSRAGKITGKSLLAELPEEDRDAFQAMLLRIQEYGKSPGHLIRLGRERVPWLVRASLMTSEPGSAFLLQLSPVGPNQPEPAPKPAVSLDALIERMPDGFVVFDQEGVVLKANQAFVDLVQVGGEGAAVGERLRRWLSKPGADLPVLLANVQKHGSVRLFRTTISGELGIETEVEISAARHSEDGARVVGVLIRDVGPRLPATNGGDPRLEGLAQQIGKTPLKKLVQDTVGAVERSYIEGALALTGGNRTAAAELLGLSRQSLHAKLNRYERDLGAA